MQVVSVRRCPRAWETTVIITRILAVYRSCPVMIVAETEEGVLLERSLKELADVYEFLPPMLWQVTRGQIQRLSGGMRPR
jgi:hypothetical protein